MISIERQKILREMTLFTVLVISIILAQCISPITAQSPRSPPLSPSPSPAPAPHYVNLTNLLSLTGPFNTFLNLLIQTNVIQTFQNQANNTNQGITIFVPTNSAFSKLEKPSLSNLSKDQLKFLLLYHAIPKFYSLSDFNNLSTHNPVSTFAGSQYTLNLTDANGLIRVGSDWSNPKISSSVYSTDPVAVYEVNDVLLPKAIVKTAPALTPAPAPAPAPDLTPASDLAPSGQKGSGPAPKSSDSGNSNSSSLSITAGTLAYMFALVFGVIML